MWAYSTVCSLLMSPYRTSGYWSLIAIEVAFLIKSTCGQTDRCIYQSGKLCHDYHWKVGQTSKYVVFSCRWLFFGSAISFSLWGSISQRTEPGSQSAIKTSSLWGFKISDCIVIKPCNCAHSVRLEQSDRKRTDALFSAVDVCAVCVRIWFSICLSVRVCVCVCVCV